MKVGEKQYKRIREKWKMKMLADFDNKVKRAFSKESKMTSIELRGVDDDPAQDIEDETIPLDPYVFPGVQLGRAIDIHYRSELRTVFDIVCGQVVNLVDRQIDEVSENGFSVTVSPTGRDDCCSKLTRSRRSCWSVDLERTGISMTAFNPRAEVGATRYR